MLKMVMNFNKVEFRTERKFFMEANSPKYPEGTWLWASFDDYQNPRICSKEDVLKMLRNPFETAQLDEESKNLIIVRSEEQVAAQEKVRDEELRAFINKTAKEAGYIIPDNPNEPVRWVKPTESTPKEEIKIKPKTEPTSEKDIKIDPKKTLTSLAMLGSMFQEMMGGKK